MRGEAMSRVCTRLLKMGVDLSSLRALEFFARAGDWQTTVYFPLVASLDAWEIDPIFEEQLNRNLPGASIRIDDSYRLAKIPRSEDDRYDFIVFDNPQGGDFGENHCEHFDALESLPNLASNKSIVIFNVNRCPFDYDANLAWRKVRENFYGVTFTEQLSSEFLLDFYNRKFIKMGFSVEFGFEEKRNEDYLSYLIFGLRK